MKFATIFFPAFIASALGTPVQQRGTSSLSSILSTLQTSVLAHDASLNQTIASLTPNSSEEDKAAAIASANSDFEGLAASIQTATTSIKNLSAAEKSGGDSRASRQLAENVYYDIYHTISNMPKDTLARASPEAMSELLSGLELLGTLLTGVVNLLGNVLQLVVGVVVATIPGLLDGLS